MPEATGSLPADVLLVARQDDGVALRLAHALEGAGRRAVILDGPAAARLFTLHGGPDGSRVAPALPVFTRPSAWWTHAPEADADARFLRAECYATFWAAASLSAAPVINRPAPTGTVQRLTAPGLATLAAQAGGALVSEIFASGPERIADPDGSLWGEDAAFRVGPVAELPPGVPLRARAVATAARYEIVAVVGDRAFPATLDPRTAAAHDLAPRSAALAKAAGVHFATITWAVAGGDAVPVRLNAGPDEAELRYAWPQVAAALCEDLAP